jgi:uncharacterized protein (DUF1810 family)
MAIRTAAPPKSDPFNLERFVEAQSGVYAQVLQELRLARKRTHWMWFIFPQLAGLGNSTYATFYAIQSREEARQYLAHPLLGKRLLECTQTLLNVEGRSASDIFDPPDDLKLCSCMTLFAQVAGQDSVFSAVLDKYFQGKPDPKTLSFLGPSSP